MKTQIINLYGGPSTGKSTSAAFLFYLFKSQNKNVELVREYVKDCYAWEKRTISTYDQIYFLGKQSHRESILYGKVSHIITDAPVMLGAYYAQKYSPPLLAEGIRAATLAFYNQAKEDGYQHHHVFLKRSKPYNPEGRYQSESEAKDIDVEVKRFLTDIKISFIECETDQESLSKLIGQLNG